MRDERLSGHARFEELCVLSASGELTLAETEELDRHVAACAECREAVSSYREFVPAGMAYLASKLTEPGSIEQEIALGESAERHGFAGGRKTEGRSVPALPWIAQQKWIAFGAMTALAVALIAAGAYRKGRHAGRKESALALDHSLSDQLKSVIAERDQINQDLQLRANRIDDLTAKLKEQTTDLVRLKNLDAEHQAHYNSLLTADQQKSSELEKVSAERHVLASKLRETEKSLADLNSQLVSVKDERQRDLVRTASSEAQVRDLSTRLKEQEQTVQTQQQFLSSDRDIRELMGARQLYIADVFDVSSDSRKRKPYGRVFYTRGKSLVFYAFDLDHQSGIKNAGAFQLWGKNESRPDRPVSLGVLYVDSEANRRWALRCDDPEQLAAIDAVFVTVEPNAHGNKPTGKPFLYASLRKEPNHP